VIPIVKSLAAQGLTVSIDTMHAEVARAALDNGAAIVNDVSGGRADLAMAGVVAGAGYRGS
jgi:dihydropteroate synthase